MHSLVAAGGSRVERAGTSLRCERPLEVEAASADSDEFPALVAEPVEFPSVAVWYSHVDGSSSAAASPCLTRSMRTFIGLTTKSH